MQGMGRRLALYSPPKLRRLCIHLILPIFPHAREPIQTLHAGGSGVGQRHGPQHSERARDSRSVYIQYEALRRLHRRARRPRVEYFRKGREDVPDHQAGLGTSLDGSLVPELAGKWD